MTYITITKDSLEESERMYKRALAEQGLDGEYSTLSKEQKEQRSTLAERKIEYQLDNSYKNTCKRKADLVVEGAEVLEKAGAKDGWIINWTKDRCGYGYYESQSWYLFKEDGNWYFKMHEACKTKHLIARTVA